MITRRRWIAATASVAVSRAGASTGAPLIDTHVHLFLRGFQFHANASYQPPAQTLGSYLAFAKDAHLDHVIVVHPEPYQDDHRILDFIFSNEPSPGFFKATCLFDPISPETPQRMGALTRKFPNRIVAVRVHENHAPGSRHSTGGAIRDRDMQSSGMRELWRTAQELGLAAQMHFIPFYAPQIAELAAQFPNVPVILDHLGRAGQGTPEQFEQVVALAKRPRTYMKYSGVDYSSKQREPFDDAQPLVRRLFDAFGPDRMMWGALGMNMSEFAAATRVFNHMFAFTTNENRAKIRGLTAQSLFRFSG